MIIFRSALVGISLALAPAGARAQSASSADSSFCAFLPTVEAAIRSMGKNDSRPWLALLSTEPGATLFSPFGHVIRGTSAVAQRYDSVAKRFEPGHRTFTVEYLSIEVDGDLATTVAVERGTFRPAGSDSTMASVTRATMIYRRERGGWKLRHRHMDHLTEGKAAR
ncbi:MAG TPA: DUF4440 domain-containing protein [Gemmatimonadales bacterium]